MISFGYSAFFPFFLCPLASSLASMRAQTEVLLDAHHELIRQAVQVDSTLLIEQLSLPVKAGACAVAEPLGQGRIALALLLRGWPHPVRGKRDIV